MSNGFGPLVDPKWLAEHLDHKPLRVVDCRWYLTDPEGGRAEYEAGHIPGAAYMSIDTDLSADHGPGRHPVPTPEEIAHRLGIRGIGDRDYVVGYDDAGGGIAARLWWMLKSIGHQRVGILDGGIQAWVASGGDLDTAEPSWPMGALSVLGASQTVDRETLAGRLGEITMLDARAPDRYRGETEPIDAAAGHIPTAINVPYAGNLGADGRFLPADELRARYESAGIDDAASTVVYCGSGVTACHNILAMDVAGLGTATLYPGSWSDWSASAGPVATGPEPGVPPRWERGPNRR